MAEFENPRLPEGINVSAGHPLKDFFGLALSVVVVAALGALVIYLGAGLVARRVPFATEARLAERFIKQKAERPAIELALQALADRLAAHMSLPHGMQIQVHYQDSATINAMATLGGNVFMYRGLLEKIPHENALAMVMAHEIAHVLHRDPVVGAGRGVAMTLALSALTAGASDGAAGTMISGTALLTGLTFSREQEAFADEAALAAVVKEYGSIVGAADLFHVFEKLRNGSAGPPKVLATHPLTADRIARIETLARERGWITTGMTTPLTERYRPPAASPAPPQDTR